MALTVATCLKTLEGIEPIEVSSVDFTMRNPARVKEELGGVLNYFARVEREVAEDPLLTMMPRLGTEYRGYTSEGRRFLPTWVAQEQRHGELLEELQRILDMEPAMPVAETTITNRIGGLLGKFSPYLHEIIEMVYLTRATMHERLTSIGYNLLNQRLRTMDEGGLTKTLIGPIRAQEGHHLNYYRTAAQTLKGFLSPAQLALARRLSMVTYAPVGAGAVEHKASFGSTAVALAGDALHEFIDPVQRIAHELLAWRGTDSLPSFVHVAVDACVELSRSESLATAN